MRLSLQHFDSLISIVSHFNKRRTMQGFHHRTEVARQGGMPILRLHTRIRVLQRRQPIQMQSLPQAVLVPRGNDFPEHQTAAPEVVHGNVPQIF